LGGDGADDFVGGFIQGFAAKIDADVGLLVEGLARYEQLSERVLPPIVLEQGALSAAFAEPGFEDLVTDSEVDDGAEASELGPILFAQNDAAAGGDDGPILNEVAEHAALMLSEGGFPVALEEEGDRLAKAVGDELVGVLESSAQFFGDEPAQGGFARAHHADEDEARRHRMDVRKGRQALF
jgi:hypothetical protein